MSAVTAIHEQHAAKKRRLAAVRNDAAGRLSAHERATAAKAAQLAEFEADYAANATAEALGEEPTRVLPDATALEKLRADAVVAEPVRRQLAANLDKCEAALAEAAADERDALSEYLRENCLEPAIAECKQAFADYFNSLIKVAAAHSLSEREFNSRARPVDTANDWFGPAAHLLSGFHDLPWEAWPYSLRPSWLPTNRYYPDSFQGFHERVAEMRAQIEQVPA